MKPRLYWRSILTVSLLGIVDQCVLLLRDDHIRDGDGDSALGGVLIAQRLDAVEHLGSDGETVRRMHLSMMTPSFFLPTRKLTSSSKVFSGSLLSTKPRSCGIGSLKIRRPTVASMSGTASCRRSPCHSAHGWVRAGRCAVGIGSDGLVNTAIRMLAGNKTVRASWSFRHHPARQRQGRRRPSGARAGRNRLHR